MKGVELSESQKRYALIWMCTCMTSCPYMDCCLLLQISSALIINMILSNNEGLSCLLETFFL